MSAPRAVPRPRRTPSQPLAENPPALHWERTPFIAVTGFVALFALILLRVPVGMAMGLVGVTGYGYLVGAAPALKMVGLTSMRTVTDYTFGVIPMFLLMGSIVSHSGMSRELFRAANSFVGHWRGGLGVATIAACGGFAAISGSSVATAATFATVAYPEMRRYAYPQSFAAGVIAAGGTLGAIFPPSGLVRDREARGTASAPDNTSQYVLYVARNISVELQELDAAAEGQFG